MESFIVPTFRFIETKAIGDRFTKRSTMSLKRQPYFEEAISDRVASINRRVGTINRPTLVEFPLHFMRMERAEAAHYFPARVSMTKAALRPSSCQVCSWREA